jgi:hypothetical protein
MATITVLGELVRDPLGQNDIGKVFPGFPSRPFPWGFTFLAAASATADDVGCGETVFRCRRISDAGTGPKLEGCAPQ